MKVLMVSEYFYPKGMGGGEISAFLLAKALAKSKIEVHVLTSKFGELKEEEVLGGVNVHRRLKTGENPVSLIENIKRKMFFEKSLLKELELLHKEERFDVIHCMNASSIAAVKLKSKIKKRFVLHANSPVLFCPKGTLMYRDTETCSRDCCFSVFWDCYFHSSLVGKIELTPFLKYNPLSVLVIRNQYEKYQKFLKEFDHCIAISTFMKKRLLMAGIPFQKITIIYNIVELGKFLRLKQPRNKVKKILYLGEYSKTKGPHVLLEALKEIKVPYEANFYGSGVLKEYLIREAKKHRLNVHINEKVSYSEIPSIMAKHDVVVMPSLVGEAFGRVALEACAAGKIVVAFDVGGIKDVVTKKNGFICRRPEELPDKIEMAMKSKIVPKVEKKFSAEVIVKKVIGIYKK